MSFKGKTISLLVCILALGGGAYLWYTSRPTSLERKEEQGVVVEAVRAKIGTITRRVTTNGTLVATQSVTLMSEVEGKIAEILFKQGADVRKGAVLIKIDDSLYRIQVQEAQAKVELAKSKYGRADSLLKKNFGTQVARDEALASLRVNEAELAAAQLRLDQTQIRAPFDGVAGLKSVSVGTFVSRSQELLSFIDLKPIYVDFSVPESYAKDLHAGQEVDAVVEGFDSLPITGEIIAIDPKADQATHSVHVRGELPNEMGQLKPGEFVRVGLELGKEEDVVLIPQVAVEREGDQTYVFLVVDGVAVRTEVTIGQKENDMIQILDGVKEGNLVITVGQLKIQDGYPVRLAEGTEPDSKKTSPEKPSNKRGTSGQGH